MSRQCSVCLVGKKPRQSGQVKYWAVMEVMEVDFQFIIQFISFYLVFELLEMWTII